MQVEHKAVHNQWCRRSSKSYSSRLSRGCFLIWGSSPVCLDRSFLFLFVIGGCYSRTTIASMSSSITSSAFNSSPIYWASFSLSFTDLKIDLASNLLSCFLISWAACWRPFLEVFSSRSGVLPMEFFRRTPDVYTLSGAYFYIRDSSPSFSSS